VYRNTGRAEKAREAYCRAGEILEKLISICPDPNYQSDFINVCVNQAGLLRDAGHLQEAKKTHERAILLAKKSVTDHPLVPDSQFDLAQQEHELGVTLVRMGRSSEAEPLFQQSIDSLNKLVKLLPRKQIYKKELGLCWIDFGLIQEGPNKEKEAEGAFAKAACTFDELVRDFPSILEFQAELASSLYHQARLSDKKGDRQRACRLLKRAIDLQSSVAHKNPSKPEYSRFLCLEYWFLAKLFVDEGKADLAESLLQEAKENCNDLPELLNDLAWSIVHEPRALAGNFDLALQMARQAVDKNPNNGNFWNTLGVAQYRMKEWQAAITALEKARALHSGGDACDLLFLAMAHWQLGNQEQARQWQQKALDALPKTGPINQELMLFQQEAAGLIKPPSPLP